MESTLTTWKLGADGTVVAFPMLVRGPSPIPEVAVTDPNARRERL
jgi:hypothetical protein